MPIMIPVEHLEPGMTLAMNIVNGFMVLLPHGHTLAETDIASLNKRFPDKLVQITDPLLDEMVEFEDTSQEHKISVEVRKNIGNVSQKISKSLRSGTALKSDNIQGMQKSIEEMMEFLQGNPVTMAIIDQSTDWDDYLQEHSANVFYLSMVIGNTIKNYIKKERERLSAAKNLSNAMNLVPLATAAILHDIGMVPIERVYSKKEPLTPEEEKLVLAHPVEGANMLPENVDPMTRLVIRCHHENQNGTGYPAGLSGEKITIFARILRVADAFSSAIAKTPFKETKSQIRVLHEMIYGEYRNLYDPTLLKVLAGIIQPFPIGAKLRLTNGKYAVATKHVQHSPFKPEVIIAFDEKDQPLPENQIEGPFPLDSRPDLQLASFANEDITYLNTVPEPSNRPAPNKDVFNLVYP